MPLTAWAQVSYGPSVEPGNIQVDSTAFEGIDVIEKLGEQIDLSLAFQNAAGESVTLAQYFGQERPVVLNFVYHDCPMLCSLVVDGLTRAMKDIAWTPGAEFDVLTVSVSPTAQQALAAKARYVGSYGRPEAAAGWHFLTGEETQIRALADQVGFVYKWIEDIQDYAHPAVLVFLSPDGTLTRYLYGIQFPPSDVRNALSEAADGKIGTTLERLILYCYQYDPAANSYVLQAVNLMKVAGGITLVLLAFALFLFWRRERNRQREDDANLRYA